MHFRAPIEKVWALIADHEGYTFAREVSVAKLLRPGRVEKNGAGALRKIRLRGITALEDILAFEPPTRLEYRARSAAWVPFRHELGRMELTTRDGGTDLRWTSRFEVPLPLVGKPLGAWLCRWMSGTFFSVLEQGKVRVEGVRAREVAG